jgi:DNA recombination protein RmuC
MGSVPAVVVVAVTLVGVVAILLLRRRPHEDVALEARLEALRDGYERIDRLIREELGAGRREMAAELGRVREESAGALRGLGAAQAQYQEALDRRLADMTRVIDGRLEGLARTLDERLEKNSEEFSRLLVRLTESMESKGEAMRATLDGRLHSIQEDNERRLEAIRLTVDEKLQSTLEARFAESFGVVREQLEQVYRGLGEMKSLATGVGDLKRVLSNVKARGVWGEVQLGNLLAEMLSPDQYEANVATTGTGQRVEYAIKLPGREEGERPVWLPIDAKFPVEDYHRLVEAAERGDVEGIEEAGCALETRVRACAKDVAEKYLGPPATTDFGILFLATEGLYAEALRRAGLAERIQREHRVILAGPTTLTALLNSLQMGFKTLAIQKRSSEVWKVLGAVKTEFGKFGVLLDKVHKKLGEATNIVESGFVRTRAIERKLRVVEELPAGEAQALLGTAEGEDDLDWPEA